MSRFDVISNVCEWNLSRDNTYFNQVNEYMMLLEELDEFATAKTDVDRADALADVIFVAIGSLYKLVGSEQKVHDIMLAVCAANDMKGMLKDENGKIMKPGDFEGPEVMIEKIIKDI